MITNKKRIRNLQRYLAHVTPGVAVTVGVADITRFQKRLLQAGFTPELENGETVLPTAVGPVTRFNANGREIIHRDQPMETVSHMREHHWTECHGKDRVEQTGFREFEYRRYPRTFVAPPSVELTIATRQSGEKVVVAPTLTFVEANHTALLHTINVFLEVFRECDLFTGDLEEIALPAYKRVNWTVLPPGKYPWEKLQKDLNPFIGKAPAGLQALMWHRLEVLNSYRPDFRAYGNAGFSGYVIMGFSEHDVYVCESVHKNNATYVFGENWEILSQRSKAEILNENLHTDRIIHRSDWEARISELFSN